MKVYTREGVPITEVSTPELEEDLRNGVVVTPPDTQEREKQVLEQIRIVLLARALGLC